MRKIVIVKPFLLSMEDGRKLPFTPGNYELEDDVAEHWYVKVHSDNPPEPNFQQGTRDYAEQQIKIKRRVLKTDKIHSDPPEPDAEVLKTDKSAE